MEFGKLLNDIMADNTYNIGQSVRFGAYGEDPDADKVFTITEIKDGVFCTEYTLQGENGNTFTAYPDEVFPK